MITAVPCTWRERGGRGGWGMEAEEEAQEGACDTDIRRGQRLKVRRDVPRVPFSMVLRSRGLAAPRPHALPPHPSLALPCRQPPAPHTSVLILTMVPCTGKGAAGAEAARKPPMRLEGGGGCDGAQGHAI